MLKNPGKADLNKDGKLTSYEKARIKPGSEEKMRKKGAKGAPTAANFKRAKQTVRT